MPLNLKKLQSIARRRLYLRGNVDFKNVSRRDGMRILSVSTNTSTLTHVISYHDISTLDPADVYHEFCKAKLNERGFTTIESAALNAIRECCKDDPKYIRDANSSLAIVSEAYTNYLLFSNFREESLERRNSIISRFESSDALINLHTQMGFWGIAGISYYKVASEWSEISFPQNQIEQALKRALNDIQKEYKEINLVLTELPKINLLNIDLSTTDSIRIVEVIANLFSLKTGIKC